MQSLGPETAMLAVFDGHTGFEAAELASEFLGHYVHQALKSLPAPHNETSVAGAVADAFQAFDKDLCYTLPMAAAKLPDKTHLRRRVNDAIAGSVAIAAVVHPLGLFVANIGAYLWSRLLGCWWMAFSVVDLNLPCADTVGDCRCVIGDSKGGALPLSHDQTGKTSSEVVRLLNEHPGEKDVVRYSRVLGQLMPTRAFGDAPYKWTEAEAEMLESSSNGQTPPYVTSRPEVLFHSLGGPDASFLILASDGIWDVMSSEDAVALVHTAMQSDSEVDELHCAGQLVRAALERCATRGGVSVTQLMTMSYPRDCRDDLTAMVVVLKQTGDLVWEGMPPGLDAAKPTSLMDKFRLELSAAGQDSDNPVRG